jgi:hypothetical protein
MIGHIFDRGLIHFFASGGITLAFVFLVRALQRRYRWSWFSAELRPQLLFVAVSIFGAAALREAFDVAAGQSVGRCRRRRRGSERLTSTWHWHGTLIRRLTT